MLQRLSLEESEADSSSISSEFEKLDLTPGTPSMASVFSSSSDPTAVPSQDSNSQSTLSRETSPSQTSQGSGRKPGFMHKRSSSHGSVERQRSKDDAMCRWLRDGTVVYKSVGLGLMDLAVGMHLVKVAVERGVGTHIEGF